MASELPQDLLCHILKRLETIEDMIRCGCVSRSWKEAIYTIAREGQNPKTAPFLLIQEKKGIRSNFDLTLFSLSLGIGPKRMFKKRFKLERRPRTALLYEGATICGFSNGWLATFYPPDLSIALVHPLTGVQVSLPSWHTEDVTAEGPGKIVWSTSPNCGSCTAIALVRYCSQLLFAKPGDESWNLFDPQRLFPELDALVDIVHFHDQFYAINADGLIIALDDHMISKPRRDSIRRVALLDEMYKDCDKYLANMFGKLLVVVGHSPFGHHERQHKFVGLEIQRQEGGGGEGIFLLSELSDDSQIRLVNCIYSTDFSDDHGSYKLRYYWGCIRGFGGHIACLKEGSTGDVWSIRDSDVYISDPDVWGSWASWVELNISQLYSKLMKLDDDVENVDIVEEFASLGFWWKPQKRYSQRNRLKQQRIKGDKTA